MKYSRYISQPEYANGQLRYEIIQLMALSGESSLLSCWVIQRWLTLSNALLKSITRYRT